MTIHALLADPPRPAIALPELVGPGLLSEREAADLAAAMIRDTMRSVTRSGGELLVNYRDSEDLPPGDADGSATSALRELAAAAVPDPDAVRYEVQVGSSFAARGGNTATHLLEEEDANSVAILRPSSPTLSRSTLDSAAMKLRRNEVVIGPAPGGRVAYLGLTEPIDFEGLYKPPAVTTIARRAADAGFSVDFLPMHLVVETASDLASLQALLSARRVAGRSVPEATVSTLDELDLAPVESEDGLSIDRR